MDSLSQIALGAAVGVAVMGRRTAVWKAAVAGAVAGTLPDLDVLIDHGDPLRNMVLHRAETHSLFWLSLFSLPFAAAVARWCTPRGEAPAWRRWWLAMWLALVTHPLLDAMTVYGTQLALPWTDHPFGVGSVFIIDPAYTLPLLVGTGWAWRTRGGGAGLKANAAGLLLSTAYLGWSAAAQAHVEGVARQSLAAQSIAADRVLVTPTAFNTVLWRVVAVSGDHYHEGFYALADATPTVRFDRFDRGGALGEAVLRADRSAAAAGADGAARLQAFTKGFFKWEEVDGRVAIADLRMGQEPAYTFRFAVAERRGADLRPITPLAIGGRPDVARGLAWLAQRVRGVPLPPPR